MVLKIKIKLDLFDRSISPPIYDGETSSRSSSPDPAEQTDLISNILTPILKHNGGKLSLACQQQQVH